MKLWRVEIEHFCYVLAENAEKAEEIGLDAVENNDGGVSLVHSKAQIASLIKNIEREWVYSIPYGGPDDQTIYEILGVRRSNETN